MLPAMAIEVCHIWSICFITVVCATVAPSVAATETKYRSFMNLVGEESLLTCIIPSDYSNYKTVTWSRGLDTPTLLTKGDRVVASGGRYSLYKPYPGDWTLRISDLRLDDQDTYTCTDSYSTFRTEVQLRLEARPEVRGYPSDVVMVNLATPAEFVIWCNATGIPLPTFRWYFKKNATAPLQYLYRKEESIMIEKDYSNLTGIYVCNATNKHGSDNVEFHLQVWDPVTTVANTTQSNPDTTIATPEMNVTAVARTASSQAANTGITHEQESTSKAIVTQQTKLSYSSNKALTYSAPACLCMNCVVMLLSLFFLSFTTW